MFKISNNSSNFFASGLLLAARKNEKLNGLNCGPRNKSSVFGLNTAPAVLDNNPVIPNASWKARTFTEFSTSLKKLLVPLAFKTSSLRFLNDSLDYLKTPIQMLEVDLLFLNPIRLS